VGCRDSSKIIKPMSKKCKAASKAKNLSAKRSRKIANKAMYAKWRDSGHNTKSFRGRKTLNKVKPAKTAKHLVGDCGNVGCKRCYPGLNYQRPYKVI
jgi:hypothetical protein